MVNITATAKTEDEIEVEVPLTPAKKLSGEPFKGRKPSDWCLTPLKDETIEAINSVTGETFEGTMEAFNARLKASN